MEHRHRRSRRRILQRPRAGDLGERELLREWSGQPARDAPPVASEPRLHERAELLDPDQPGRVARCRCVLGFSSGQPDVQHHRPMGLARSHGDCEQRRCVAESERRLPATTVHCVGPPRDDVQHRRPGPRPGLSLARYDRPAASAASATTASAATAAEFMQRRGDHDPRLGERDPVPVDLRRLRLLGDDHRPEPDRQQPLAHVAG